MRKLKYHEQKLLKKVNLYDWKKEDNLREVAILRRYHIQKREEYLKYNKICGMIRSLVAQLKKLDSTDEFRIRMTEQLLEKLFNMGVITTKKSLVTCETIPASAFCRRRLPVVMMRMKMSETLREAVTFIEQGHVRVGPEVITDPAFLVSRPFEDFVTWVDSSKIKKTIMRYNEQLDDFDLLQD